jgi:hypothetical protein
MLIAPNTPVPTRQDCTKCDTQGNQYLANGRAIRGARYFRGGAYRPQYNCRASFQSPSVRTRTTTIKHLTPTLIYVDFPSINEHLSHTERSDFPKSHAPTRVPTGLDSRGKRPRVGASELDTGKVNGKSAQRRVGTPETP